MTTYIALMKIELDQLSAKIGALDVLISRSMTCAVLDLDDHLLKIQRDAMTTYESVLSARLARARRTT